MTAPRRLPEWHGREAVHSSSAAAVLLAPRSSVLQGSPLARSKFHSCRHFNCNRAFATSPHALAHTAGRQLCCLRQLRGSCAMLDYREV